MDNCTLPAVLDNQSYRGQTSDATVVRSENPMPSNADVAQDHDCEDKYRYSAEMELWLKRLQPHACIAGVAHIAPPNVRAFRPSHGPRADTFEQFVWQFFPGVHR